jgi:hypothetical protein
MKPVIKETKIDTLIPDDLNANKGTQYGSHLIEKSFRELGAGRSILLDKNNRIIAGNKSIEAAASIGLENVIIVETTGDQIVAVKRKDIDLDSQKGRELALADNSTSKANLEWDAEAVDQITQQWDIKPEDWGVRVEISENDPEEEWKGMPGFNSEDKMGAKQIIVHFKTMDDFFRFALIIGQNLTEKTKSIWFPEEEKGSQTDHAYTEESKEGESL